MTKHNSPSGPEAGQATPAVQECLRMLRAIASDPAMNEEARKQLFILHLRSIFPEEEYRSRFEALAAGAETRVATTPSALSGAAWGFMDTRNGELVIEFKANLPREVASRRPSTQTLSFSPTSEPTGASPGAR